jgi:serine/threonine protein kinase
MFLFISEYKINRLLKNYIGNRTPFLLQEMIGKGSYGIAYSIVHKETGTRYVLKRMRAKHRKKDYQIQKFKQEISILKQLNLPNVPKVYLNGDVDGIPFYIMEYINGHTFEQEIFSNGKLYSLEESFTILKKLFNVVINIHDKKIVHRDLRIPNILVKNDMIYIIDFGLASYIKNDVLIEELDNPKKLEDYRSDLYYIGHFLLYLLYSNYSPTNRKERSWQEELQLPQEVEKYIERLLLIGPAFSSAEEALQSIPSL